MIWNILIYVSASLFWLIVIKASITVWQEYRQDRGRGRKKKVRHEEDVVAVLKRGSKTTKIRRAKK